MRKTLAATLIAPLCFASLAACSIVPASSGSHQASSQHSSGQNERTMRAQPARVAIAQPAPFGQSQPARQCLTQLGQAGVQFTPVPDMYTGDGCSNLGTVQMTALQSDISNMSVSNIGPVRCEVGNAFAAWARFGVDRAARQILGTGLQRIETFGSYSCRNVAGTSRRSAHATAGAIDIAGFVLEDGRRITVASDWNGGSASEREFLRTIQRSACRRFDTVLGPDYNAAHRDHFHVEGVIDGSSFCR